mgnify:FL=1
MRLSAVIPAKAGIQLLMIGLMGLAACARTADTIPSVFSGNSLCQQVRAVPDEVRGDFSLAPFYKKYVDANGLPILSSDAPDDESLRRACRLVVNMLSKRSDAREKLIELRVRFVVIGRDEGTADIPEYGFRDKPQAEKDAINARARGIGSQASSCGEENLMCLAGDRYPAESICVHEFSHTIHEALKQLDPNFEDRLKADFNDASSRGILKDTYRSENYDEYWAEGVQDWYDTNAEADPPDGIHNAVNTRKELESFDPRLFALIGEVFPERIDWGNCHIKP